MLIVWEDWEFPGVWARMWAQIPVRTEGRGTEGRSPCSASSVPFIGSLGKGTRLCGDQRDPGFDDLFLKADLSALGGDFSHPERLKFRKGFRLSMQNENSNSGFVGEQDSAEF